MRDSRRGYSDTVDVGEAMRAVARGWRWVLGGTLVGVGLGLLVLALGPVRYEAIASVTLMDRTEGGSSSLGLAGGALTEGLSGLVGLPAQLGSNVGTEAEVLQSRALLERVVASLGLQIAVVSPRHTGALSLFTDIRAEVSPEDYTFRFDRDGGSYQVSGAGIEQQTVAPGGDFILPGFSATLASEGVPESFQIRVRSKQEVVERMLRKEFLTADIVAGDLARVRAVATDAATAAAMANRAVELYLQERTSRSRGLTDGRHDLLRRMSDSLRAELTIASGSMTAYLEQETVFDPDRLGDLERAGALRVRVDALQVEAKALDDVLVRMASGDGVATDILAYPSFLGSEAINDVLSRVFTLQSERMALLRRRTERDPEVIVIGQTLDFLDRELQALARSYRSGLELQLNQLSSGLEEYRRTFAARPAEEEQKFALEGEVERLTASYIAVQAQLVQARLATIGLGADLRQIDVPPPPREPYFPVSWMTLVLGLGLGGLAGVGLALVRDAAQGLLRSSMEAARITGLPAVGLDIGATFLTLGRESGWGVTVVPVGEGVDATVVAGLVHSAAVAQDASGSLIDLR
ncbi:MAG: hypothetical protein HOD00_12355, partial [Gemmatimonadales bacterium]|nr:hypothetical protein [Gemmatimonadales bacterium]